MSRGLKVIDFILFCNQDSFVCTKYTSLNKLNNNNSPHNLFITLFPLSLSNPIFKVKFSIAIFLMKIHNKLSLCPIFLRFCLILLLPQLTYVLLCYYSPGIIICPPNNHMCHSVKRINIML